MSWEEIKLVYDKNDLEIKPIHNGKSLTEIKIRNGDTIIIEKKEKI